MKINITSNLLTKLNVLSSEYNIEVGGYLIGEIRAGEIYLQDILIPNQLITGVQVHIRPIDQIDLLKRYGDKCKKVIGKFHSHHSMGVFWSPTDDNDIKEIMEYKDFYVFMVGSLGHYSIKVCVRRPFKYEINDAKLYLKTVDLDIMRKQVNKLIERNTNSSINNFRGISDKEAANNSERFSNTNNYNDDDDEYEEEPGEEEEE